MSGSGHKGFETAPVHIGHRARTALQSSFRAVIPREDQVGFARVKTILDQGIATWQAAPGNHNPANLSGHGNTFSWGTKVALLAAVGHGKRLIDPTLIGNGK